VADIPTLRAKVEAAQALAAKATRGPRRSAGDCQSGGLDYVHVEVPIHPEQNVSEAILATIKRYGAHKEKAEGNADLMAAAPDLVTLATDLLVALEAAQAERDEARARAMRAEDAKKAAATAAAMDERAAIALWLERNNPIPGWQASPGGTKIGDYLASLFRRGVHRG